MLIDASTAEALDNCAQKDCFRQPQNRASNCAASEENLDTLQLNGCLLIDASPLYTLHQAGNTASLTAFRKLHSVRGYLDTLQLNGCLLIDASPLHPLCQAGNTASLIAFRKLHCVRGYLDTLQLNGCLLIDASPLYSLHQAGNTAPMAAGPKLHSVRNTLMPSSSMVACSLMPMPFRTILRDPSDRAPLHVTTCVCECMCARVFMTAHGYFGII
eukprot:1147548-Pelagomonas_calceolata.AAC.1